jgi:transposase-like protein
MSNQRYPEEFKIQAVTQVTEKQLPVSEVASMPGLSATPSPWSSAFRRMIRVPSFADYVLS